jgi:hypothetical protein
MDVVLQSQPPEYGPGRFHPKAASGHGCITVLLLKSVEIGGITSGNTYDIDKVKGKWTKIEIHAKWLMEADDEMPNGFYKVYINDELFYEYKGNTVSSNGIDEIYFKYGIYRVQLDRLLGSKPPTQIVYYSNVKREKVY